MAAMAWAWLLDPGVGVVALTWAMMIMLRRGGPDVGGDVTQNFCLGSRNLSWAHIPLYPLGPDL
jgi:hypothetical protein